MERKHERYNRNTVPASELADLLEREKKDGWMVVSAEYDGDDFVVEFEKE